MPLYEWQCPKGHRLEVLRPMRQRNRKVACPKCGVIMGRVVSRSHIVPDGVYSYAPNVGDPARFERQQQAMKEGVKVIPRHDP